jgi:ATP synthase protein I
VSNHQPAPDPPESARSSTPDRRQVDLSARAAEAEAIAARSRAAGIWSLHHLRLCWAALLAAGLVLGAAAALIAGAGAVAGVAMGVAIVGGFFTVSAVAIARVGALAPGAVMVAALLTYVVKIVLLALVLLTMPIDGFVNTRWMAGAVAVGLVAWLAAHLRYVWTLKLFYVDPG